MNFLKVFVLGLLVIGLISCSGKKEEAITNPETNPSGDTVDPTIKVSGLYISSDANDENFFSYTQNGNFRKTEVLEVSVRKFKCKFEMQGLGKIFKRAQKNRDMLLPDATHYIEAYVRDIDLKGDVNSMPEIHKSICLEYRSSIESRMVYYYFSIFNNRMTFYNDSQTKPEELARAKPVVLSKQ